MSPEVVRHRTVGAFLERAGAWLLEREDRHNLILSLAQALADGDGAAPGADVDGPVRPLFATVEEGGRVVGGVFRTPPHQVLLTDMPAEAVALAARAVSDVYASIPAVLGPRSLAESFADEWVSIRGGAWRPGTDQRLYRLDEVTALGAPGGLRLASAADSAFAAAWLAAFVREVHMPSGPPSSAVAEWIDRGFVFFWEDEGAPVSMAVAHGRTSRGVRVGYVYTPPELRRRGYAGACVSELSERLLASGFDFCVLYADVSNPTSTALYHKMGYRPVADFRDYHFQPAGAPS